MLSGTCHCGAVRLEIPSPPTAVTLCNWFAIGRNAAYLFCPPGVRQSKAWKALLGKEGRTATTRNWQTVLKLQALATGANPDVD